MCIYVRVRLVAGASLTHTRTYIRGRLTSPSANDIGWSPIRGATMCYCVASAPLRSKLWLGHVVVCTRCMQERDTPGAPLDWNLGSRRQACGARRRPCIGKASLSMLQMIDYWRYTLYKLAAHASRTSVKSVKKAPRFRLCSERCYI
jgi:hypothetical protein